MMAAVEPSRIRSFCIIAHIDHGKTTLADRLLSQAQALTSSAAADSPSTASGSSKTAGGSAGSMDSGVLERERGITILS
ncbi:putative GTP-binding protein TypA/BipA like protein, partial [Haematococcus lacustris]